MRRTGSATTAPNAPPLGIETTPWTNRWGRRAIVLPAFGLLAVLGVTLLPVLLLLAAVGDVLRPRRWALVRCVSFFVFYLLCELVGVLAAFAAWLASGVWLGASRERFVRWNFALQCLWGPALYRGAAFLFGLRTEVEGAEEAYEGPIIVLIRHLSVADTVIPVTFVSRPSGLQLRYVLKSELLWDPCLDIVGQRLPNYFVQRGSGERAREVAGIQRLMDGLGPRDGVLIYPEGTRFSARTRERILAKLLATGEHDAYRRAAAFTNVLPPRLGGTLGLLERNDDPCADVVFCAHTGLEGARSFWSILDGALVGSTVRVRFWRIPFGEIPREHAARVRWLDDQWTRIDRWVAAAQAPSHDGDVADGPAA